MSVNDNDMQNRRKFVDDSPDDGRSRSKAVHLHTGKWSVEEPGAFVKKMLGINLRKSSITLSEDNVIMIDGDNLLNFIKVTTLKVIESMKTNKLKLEKIENMLLKLPGDSEKRSGLEEARSKILNQMDAWTKTFSPHKVTQEVNTKITNNKKYLKESIKEFNESIGDGKFNNFKNTDLFDALKKLKEIKIKILEMSRDLENYTQISAISHQDIGFLGSLIGRLTFDAYDFIVVNSSDHKIHEVSSANANLMTERDRLYKISYG